MSLIYINHSRIPTEKAHGVNIISMCQAFYNQNNDLTLIIPNIKNHINSDLYQYYGLVSEFSIKRLPTISALRWEKYLGKFSFWFQFNSFYISVCLYLLFRSRKNVIIYTRDYPAALLSFLGYQVIYECHGIPKYEKIFFYLAKFFDKIIVISKGLEGYFLKYGFDPEKIFIASDAVNLEKFDINISTEEARKKLFLPEYKKIICYCGKFKTMGMDKGILDILRSLRYLSDEILFLAVGGDERDVEYYKNIAKDLKVDQQVMFVGHISQEYLAYYQKASDILLMPFPYNKHYAEYMSPIKMFEYMASHKPIVASDLPTIREVLNEKNCIFCQPDNPENLADRIKYTLDHSNHAQSVADQAYKDVQKFSWSNRVKGILNFIY